MVFGVENVFRGCLRFDGVVENDYVEMNNTIEEYRLDKNKNEKKTI